MEVKLINCTRNPEMTCAAAAQTSWKKESGVENFSQMTEEKAKALLQRVISYGHFSVLEHASFTFAVSGISRACSHQLVRHRIASYTQQSQRYVKFGQGEIECVVPPTLNPEQKKKFEEIMKLLADEYQALLAQGVPAEDARYLLPNAAQTKIIITMNARELIHFCNLRLCTRAQWEIRHLAGKMLAEAKRAAPTIFSDVGPQCKLYGYCTEGKMSCGLYPTKEELAEYLKPKKRAKTE